MQTYTIYNTRMGIDVINNFVDSAEFQPKIDLAIRKRLAPNGEPAPARRWTPEC